MKNFSLGLNVLLLAAVAFLYIKVFSKNNVVPKNDHPVTIANVSAAPGKNDIAFVELDSLNEKIGYIKTKRSELETEQRGIEAEWQNAYRNIDAQKNAFLKRGNSITQAEAEKMQEQLLGQQQLADQKKQASNQKLSDKSYKFMEDLQRQLKDFLKGYNDDHRYRFIFTTGTGLDYMIYKDSALNISDDVIKGMNEKMNAKK